jgi:hypothetical protein
MSGTLHLQVRDRAVALLAAAGAALADGGVIAGRRKRAMPEQFKRQVFVYLDYAKPTRADLSAMPDDWLTRLRIECAARPAAPLTGEQNADDCAQACYALLAADPSLGGLCMDLIPLGLAWDEDEAAEQLAVTQVLFDAKHRTPATSIAA